MKSIGRLPPAEFRSFMSSAGKNIFFTILFYCVWIVAAFTAKADFTLHHFEDRMIGIATLNAFDIGARVKLFYYSIAVLLFSFLLLSLAAFIICKRLPGVFSFTEVKIINYSALAGAGFFLFGIMGFKCDNALEFIYFLHKLMLCCLIGRQVRPRFLPQLTVKVYAMIISLCVSIYFLVSEMAIFCGADRPADLWLITAILFAAVTISTRYWKQHTSKVLYSAVPLMFLPFVSLLKDEIFLILKARDSAVSPALIFFLLLLLLIIWIFFRYRKISRTLFAEKINLRHLLANRYFPLLLFSLISYTYYSSYILKNNLQDMFEPANRYLPILELQNWGTIPFIEKFNSHLLSDIFFNAIYALFNEVKINDAEIYDFLAYPLMGCLYYFLILFLTRNSYVSIYFILFFPLYYSLCPYEHCCAVIGIYALYKILYGNQSTRSYLTLFGVLFFLALWRIDVGFSFVLLAPLMLLYFHFFTSRTKLHFISIIKAFVISGLTISAVLLVLSFIRHVNLFSKIPYILNYLSSAQTYGLPPLGDPATPAFKMHYFIFPFCTFLIIMYLLFSFPALNKSKRQRLAYTTLLAICIYYFVNFQRGLVRHSLFEGTDNFTTSFFYIILVGAVYIFMQRASQAVKFSALTIILFFTLLYNKVPAVSGSEGIFETTSGKLSRQVTLVDTLQSRTVYAFKGDSRANDKKELINFLKNKLAREETFIDFTNTPMLYFFTAKPTPSFFYQNPICSHNDFLQERFIKDLKDYHTPYLIFDLVNGPNGMDDVPNYFRHYRVAEYFYENFQPDTVVDGVSVWKQRTGSALNSDSAKQTKPVVISLKHLPFIWANYDKNFLKEKQVFHRAFAETLSPQGSACNLNNLGASDPNTLVLELINLSDTIQNVSVNFGSGNTAAEVKFYAVRSADPKYYAIRISCIYNWFIGDKNSISISCDNDRMVKLKSVAFTREQ